MRWMDVVVGEHFDIVEDSILGGGKERSRYQKCEILSTSFDY